MFLKSSNKAITVVVLSTFLISSAVPTNVNSTSIENLTDKEAVFGWCRLKRIRKKTKRLVKSIEKLKNGETSVEEVTLEIASLKKTANKAFKKNYKIQNIMHIANRKIEEFMYSLLHEESEHISNKFEGNFTKEAELFGSYDLQNQYESIQSFLSDLQNYEDFESNERYDKSLHLLKKEFIFLKNLQAVTNLIGNSTGNNDDPEAKILFAYVSIFCGCLLCIIPTPFTRNAGFSLISGGLYVLGEDKVNELDLANKNKKEVG